MIKCPHCQAPVLVCGEYCLKCVPAVRVGAFRVLHGQIAWIPVTASEGAPAPATFAVVDPSDGEQLAVLSVATTRGDANGPVVLEIKASDKSGASRSLQTPLGELVCRYGREGTKTEVLP